MSSILGCGHLGCATTEEETLAKKRKGQRNEGKGRGGTKRRQMRQRKQWTRSQEQEPVCTSNLMLVFVMTNVLY